MKHIDELLPEVVETIKGSGMKTYAICLKKDGLNVVLDAEYYDIRDGFIRLYKPDPERGVYEEFASFAADCVEFIRHQPEIVEDQE